MTCPMRCARMSTSRCPPPPAATTSTSLSCPVQSYESAALERIINLESAVNQSIKNFNRFLVIGLQIKREEFSPMCITQTQQVIIDYTPIVLVLIRGSQSFLVYNISPVARRPGHQPLSLSHSVPPSLCSLVCSHTSLNSLA